jgi:hypothetical protein
MRKVARRKLIGGVVVLIRRGWIVLTVLFNKLPALDFSPILKAAAGNRGITLSRMVDPGGQFLGVEVLPAVWGGLYCRKMGSATIPAPSPKPTVL